MAASITKELLLQRIADLRQQQIQAAKTVQATGGAIQVLEELLRDLEKESA